MWNSQSCLKPLLFKIVLCLFGLHFFGEALMWYFQQMAPFASEELTSAMKGCLTSLLWQYLGNRGQHWLILCTSSHFSWNPFVLTPRWNFLRSNVCRSLFVLLWRRGAFWKRPKSCHPTAHVRGSRPATFSTRTHQLIPGQYGVGGTRTKPGSSFAFRRWKSLKAKGVFLYWRN